MRAVLRTAACLSLTIVGMPAQSTPFDLPAAMQQMATAVTALQKAVAAHQRDAYQEPLRTLATTIQSLQHAGLELPSPTTAAEALTSIQEAIADFASPVADGVASDPFDLARLRRGCTACHVASRTRNDERGMFPNQHTIVAGALQLVGLDGVERTERGGIVVFLERAGQKVEPLPRSPAISQRGRQFHPSVLAVTVGTVVNFPNDDVVFHNVFSLSRTKTFDLGTYAKGQTKDVALTTPGLVKVFCNIHPDMAADVLVLDSPLSAVSNNDGWWLIPDVPPGDYTLRVWHGLADEQRLPLHVEADGLLPVPLVVRETKPRVQHTNKYGRSYPSKY